jgi:hypothetical protein
VTPKHPPGPPIDPRQHARAGRASPHRLPERCVSAHGADRHVFLPLAWRPRTGSIPGVATHVATTIRGAGMAEIISFVPPPAPKRHLGRPARLWAIAGWSGLARAPRLAWRTLCHQAAVPDKLRMTSASAYTRARCLGPYSGHVAERHRRGERMIGLLHDRWDSWAF